MDDSEKRVESHNIEKGHKERIIIPILEKINIFFERANFGEDINDEYFRAESRVRNLRAAYDELGQLIINIFSDVESFQYQKWSKKYKKKEDREKNPYDDEHTDTKRLSEIRKDLIKRSKEIQKAKFTRRKDDDFITIYENQIIKREEYGVNERFYSYKEKLEEHYIEIMHMMGENGITMYRKDEEYSEKSFDEEIDDAFSI